jgi:hypothetical protein
MRAAGRYPFAARQNLVPTIEQPEYSQESVTGVGSFSLSTPNILFDSSVSAGQTITAIGADSLRSERRGLSPAPVPGPATRSTR